MNDTIFLGLVQNAALLLALALIFDLTLTHWRAKDQSLRQIPLGVVLGGIGIALMLTPWVMVPGIIFDTRSILLGIAGLFFGLVPTAVAMLITIAFRLTQGGTATVMGVCVILVTGSLGITWRKLRQRPLLDISWRELYLFGLLIHAVMLACAFTLPWTTALQVLSRITLPVLLIYPVGTALLGALMANRLRREREADQRRESEARLRLAVEASNVGFFDQDLLTNREHYSAEWKKQIGYAEDELSDDIREWQTRVHPDDLEYALARLDDCIKGVRPEYEAEYRLRHKDGSYRWILARGMLQYNAEGQAVRLLGCHIDITRQKQGEGLYRVLTENIQDVVWVLDTATMYFRYVSPSVQRLRGYTAAEILAQPLDHALTDQARAALLGEVHSQVEAFRAGQIPPGTFFTDEVEQPCKDGSTVWTEIVTSFHLNPDNGHVEVQGVTRNIAARRRAEEALRESEDKFHYMFDYSVVGNSITLPSGEINANQAFCDMLGYTREEIRDKKWQDITHPEDIALNQRAAEQILSGEKESARFEKRYLHKNGAPVWVDINTSLRRGPQGEPLYFMTTLIDITARKQIEQTLRRSEENYRQLFEQAADGIFIADTQGNFIDVNMSGCALIGYNREEILKLNLRDLIPMEELKENPLRLNDLQNGLQVYNERRMICKDGSLVDVEISGRRLADGRFLGMARNISDRKRALRKQQESEIHYHSLFKNMLNGFAYCQMVFVNDVPEDFIYLEVNDEFEHLTGLKNVTGKKVSEVIPGIHDSDPALFEIYGRVALQGNPEVFEMYIEALNDWYSISVYSPARGFFVAIFDVITERKRAEEKVQASQNERRQAEEVLKKNEALLTEMGRTGKIGGWQFDAETLKQIWTEEVYHIHEVGHDFENTVAHAIAFYAPSSRPVIERAVQRAIDFGEAYDLELEFITAKGKHLWVHTIGKAQQEHGKTKTVNGTFQDISERKLAEDQVRRLNAELEQRVRERTLQLESANKELESFAYSVSHDLRAPLRAMDGFSSVLLSDYPSQIDEKGRHYLERIQEASRRMGQLINDLLSLSRVTRSEFNRQPVDLSEIAREIAASLGSQDPQRTLEFEIAPGLLCLGDPHLLRIVLENLLNNAVKFSGTRDLARIQVGALEPEGQKGERVFFVRDNGVGFDMNYAGKLFAPFQRLHGMQEFPGTGIGLVTVQRIIHRHGGRVWPEAAPDHGATFFFTLGEA